MYTLGCDHCKKDDESNKFRLYLLYNIKECAKIDSCLMYSFCIET